MTSSRSTASTVDVDPGEVFGFLGPNGAGKSSTMRMIGCVSDRLGRRAAHASGSTRATDGAEIRARLGVVPAGGQPRHRADASGTTSSIYGRYFGIARPLLRERADELLEFVQLTDRRDQPSRSAVGRHEAPAHDRPGAGQRARAAAARRAHHRARPAGAPPGVGAAVPAEATGVTLVLTTHYMDEAEQLCDRLVIMDGGRIVAEGSPRELIERHATREVVEVRFAATSRSRPRSTPARDRRARRAAGRPGARVHRRRRRGRGRDAEATACGPSRCSCGAARSRTCS